MELLSQELITQDKLKSVQWEKKRAFQDLKLGSGWDEGKAVSEELNLRRENVILIWERDEILFWIFLSSGLTR